MKLKFKFGHLCVYIVKIVRKSVMGNNLQQMTKMVEGLCLYTHFDHTAWSIKVKFVEPLNLTDGGMKDFSPCLY